MAEHNMKPRSKKGSDHSVVRFEARIIEHTAKTGTSLRINIPHSVGKKLHGMTTIEGTINHHPFRTALESDTSGGRWLRVNTAMRKGAGAAEGDTVHLAVLGPEPELTVPADLRAPLRASKKAKTEWNDLTPTGQRDWVRWIEAAKTPETRARRVRRTIDQLSEGKRRPCCVNVYEYMLCRVQKTRATR